MLPMFRSNWFIFVGLLVLGIMPMAVSHRTCWAAEPRGDECTCCESGFAPSSRSIPQWPPTWEVSHGITFRLRGRIDTDAIWSSQSAENIETFGNLSDVIGLRRARIGAEGEIGDSSRYVAEIDLASGDAVPRDIYFALGRIQEMGESQVGHFREPFSLEGGTSARFFPFMERSPINQLDPARSWGLGWFREFTEMNSSLSLGVFQAGTGTWDFDAGEGSTVGFTGRLTKALVYEDKGKRLVHLGLALSERVPEDGVIIINQRPRSPLLELGDSSTSAFVSRIRIPARFQQLINLQLAAAEGSFWTQAEWYGTFIDQIGGDWVFYHGCHVDAGYFLTGEHRAYETSSGTLGAIRVNRPLLRLPDERDRPRGWGAWELAARFSYLDYFDSNTPLGPAGQRVGTQLPQSTVGVNWYLSDRVRLMFNYSYATPDDIESGASSVSIFGTRLAVFW